MEMDLVFPEHAGWRAARRGLAETEVEYILLHGVRFHCDGALIYYLRRRDIPVEHLAVDRWARLEGCAVIIARGTHTVITVWRNRRSGLKRIRRKPSYNRAPQTMPDDLQLLLVID